MESRNTHEVGGWYWAQLPGKKLLKSESASSSLLTSRHRACLTPSVWKAARWWGCTGDRGFVLLPNCFKQCVHLLDGCWSSKAGGIVGKLPPTVLFAFFGPMVGRTAKRTSFYKSVFPSLGQFYSSVSEPQLRPCLLFSLRTRGKGFVSQGPVPGSLDSHF